MSTNASRREQLRRQREAQARAKRNQRIIGAVAGVIALILVVVLVVVLVQSKSTGTDSQATAAQITPAHAEGNAIVVAQGNAGTPTVTLYLDYQCPNCRTFELNFGQMLSDTAKAGEWTLEYKTMTFMDNNLSNTASTRAALGAACAADTDLYEAYHEQVYANQATTEVVGSEGYSDTLLRETIPSTIGLTGDALTSFQACYDGKATQDFVDSVDKSAYNDGVSGTPTLAVNGKVVSLSDVSPFTEDGLKAFILANA